MYFLAPRISKSQKGFGILSLIFYLLAGAIIVVGLVYVWNLKKKVDSTSLSINPIVQKKDISTSGWNNLKNTDLGITIKYPSDWVKKSDSAISQYQTKEGVLNEYNRVSLTRQKEGLYSGYLNIDIFNKLYGLQTEESFIRDYYNQDQEKMVKLGSGKIFSGERYVIFRLESGGLSQEVQKLVDAYILSGDSNNSLYILSFNNYDDHGLAIFKKIVSSAIIK